MRGAATSGPGPSREGSALRRSRTTEAVMAILSPHDVLRWSDTALPLHASTQLVALGVHQADVALTEIGTLLVLQDAALLRLVAGRECQRRPGRNDGYKLPKQHRFTHLQASKNTRSEERREGKECVRTFKTRWSP